MYLRLGICGILLLCRINTWAQSDSVLLKTVTVYGLKDADFLVGSRITTLDSSLLNQQNSHHLGELLSFQLPIYFRNYGNGMLSGVSMRGTSPQHVAVRWNGININSFSLGQSDFSLLPGVAFDDVKVHEGGGSARFGSGAFGGSVLLSTLNKTSTILTFHQDFGSFGRYFNSFKANISKGKVSATSSLYHVQAQNDFPLKQTTGRQTNAAFKQSGFIEKFEYHISPADRITVDYWYHQASRDIQPNIGNTSSRDHQDDRNHRVIVSYDHSGHFGSSKIGLGFVDDVIVYNSAKSEVSRWISSASHQYTLFGQWHVSLDAEWNHIIGKLKEYGAHQPIENRIDIGGSVFRNFKNLSASFNLRQPFITNVTTPLLPYLGVNVRIIESERMDLNVLANVSRNFRAPTLNDRYWLDQGKKDLLPETSNAAEGGVTWTHHKGLSASVTGFYQHVDEWIQWVPEANGIFRPQNIKTVVAKGIETSLEGKKTVGSFSLSGRISYQLTRSETTASHFQNLNDVGKQLIYTPVHTGAAMGGVGYRTWHFNVAAQYSGKRYTETSNTNLYALQSFALVDVYLSKSFAVNRHDFAVSFTIKNIFNTNYKLYEGKAMPGTNFNVKLYYQLKRKNS